MQCSFIAHWAPCGHLLVFSRCRRTVTSCDEWFVHRSNTFFSAVENEPDGGIRGLPAAWSERTITELNAYLRPYVLSALSSASAEDLSLPTWVNTAYVLRNWDNATLWCHNPYINDIMLTYNNNNRIRLIVNFLSLKVYYWSSAEICRYIVAAHRNDAYHL